MDIPYLKEEMEKYYGVDKFIFGVDSFKSKLKELGLSLLLAYNDDKYRCIDGIRYVYGSDPIFLKCSICGCIFSLRLNEYNRRMKKISSNVLICKKRECLNKKVDAYIKKIVGDGTFWNFGKIVTEEEKLKRLNTINDKYGSDKPWSVKRRGKSLEEFYGHEAAERTVKARKEGYDKYVSEHGHPMLGKTHNEESRNKMSESHIKFLEEHGDDKVYIHPETGELIDWYENYSTKISRHYQNLTPEEREKISENMVLSFFDRDGNWGKNTKKGYFKNWFTLKDEKYDSSYEEAAFIKLNGEKKFWKKNLNIYIKYLNPLVNEYRYYVPDILIFKDESFTKIIEIIEVKPFQFVYKESNNDYHKITKAKLKSLEDYCKDNNYICSIYTEIELEDYFYETTKEIKGRVRNAKKYLLSECSSES